MTKLIRGLAFALVCGYAGRVEAAGSCNDLMSLNLPLTTITQAKVEGEACRVAATLRPSSDSEIKMEVWMPTANWNGRYQAVGNGAFNGNINFNAMGVP